MLRREPTSHGGRRTLLGREPASHGGKRASCWEESLPPMVGERESCWEESLLPMVGERQGGVYPTILPGWVWCIYRVLYTAHSPTPWIHLAHTPLVLEHAPRSAYPRCILHTPYGSERKKPMDESLLCTLES